MGRRVKGVKRVPICCILNLFSLVSVVHEYCGGGACEVRVMLIFILARDLGGSWSGIGSESMAKN